MNTAVLLSRDQIATQAMQAILSNPELFMQTRLDESLGKTAQARVATLAYRYADAMIEARGK
jgi:hypothetical protein